MFRIDKVISNDNDFATFKNQYSKLLKESNLGNVKVVVDGKYNRSFIAKDWLAQRGFLMSKSTKPLLSPSTTNNYMYLKKTHSKEELNEFMKTINTFSILNTADFHADLTEYVTINLLRNTIQEAIKTQCPTYFKGMTTKWQKNEITRNAMKRTRIPIHTLLLALNEHQPSVDDIRKRVMQSLITSCNTKTTAFGGLYTTTTPSGVYIHTDDISVEYNRSKRIIWITWKKGDIISFLYELMTRMILDKNVNAWNVQDTVVYISGLEKSPTVKKAFNDFFPFRSYQNDPNTVYSRAGDIKFNDAHFPKSFSIRFPKVSTYLSINVDPCSLKLRQIVNLGLKSPPKKEDVIFTFENTTYYLSTPTDIRGPILKSLESFVRDRGNFSFSSSIPETVSQFDIVRTKKCIPKDFNWMPKLPKIRLNPLEIEVIGKRYAGYLETKTEVAVWRLQTCFDDVSNIDIKYKILKETDVLQQYTKHNQWIKSALHNLTAQVKQKRNSKINVIPMYEELIQQLGPENTKIPKNVSNWLKQELIGLHSTLLNRTVPSGTKRKRTPINLNSVIRVQKILDRLQAEVPKSSQIKYSQISGMKNATEQSLTLKTIVQAGFWPGNTKNKNTNATGVLQQYSYLNPTKVKKFFQAVLKSVLGHMHKFNITKQEERIHAIYAAFDVSRAVAYNTDIVSEYLDRVASKNNQTPTDEEKNILKEYMKTEPMMDWEQDAAKASIRQFLSSLSSHQINMGRTCNLQSLFVPAIGFAIGKYFGTCMDEMLVEFYDNEQTGAPNMHGSHFFVNKSLNMPANKEEVFLKLVFPGVFRHIFCKGNDSKNRNRNCANASALVWLLENVLKKTSLDEPNKNRLRTYLIVRTKKPVVKKHRPQRKTTKKNVGQCT